MVRVHIHYRTLQEGGGKYAKDSDLDYALNLIGVARNETAKVSNDLQEYISGKKDNNEFIKKLAESPILLREVIAKALPDVEDLTRRLELNELREEYQQYYEYLPSTDPGNHFGPLRQLFSSDRVSEDLKSELSKKRSMYDDWLRFLTENVIEQTKAGDLTSKFYKNYETT